MSAPDELDQIAAEAAALDLDTAAAMPGAEPVEPPVDPAQEWRDAAQQGGALLLAVHPELKPDWTPARLDALGDALARCADHYGWTLGAIFGHPLIGLAFAAWPLGVPLVRLSKEKAQRKANEAANRGESPAGAVASDKPESVFSRAGNIEIAPAS